MTVKNFTFFCLILLVICFLCLNQYLLHAFRMGVFYNSDSLYVPQLVQDLKAGIDNIFNWNLSRAPSFIDIIVFYLLNLFLNSYMSIIGFGILQIGLTFWITYKVFSHKFSTEFSICLATLSFLGLLVLLLEGVHPFLVILKSAHHYSEFLIWMVLSLLFLKYIKCPKPSYAYVITVISFVQTVSDQFILIHFIAPATLTLILLNLKGYIKTKHSLFFVSLLLVSSVIGLLISFSVLDSSSSVSLKLSVTTIENDVDRLVGLFSSLVGTSVVVTFCYVIFFTGLIYGVVKKGVAEVSGVYFILMSLITILTLIVLPDKNILFRYLIPILYTPILLYGYFIPKQFEKYLILPLTGLNVILLIFLLMTHLNTSEWNDEFYPEHVECIDSSVDSINSKNFAGGFWDARHVSFLSKTGVYVQPFSNNFTVIDKVSNHKKIQKHYSNILIDTKNNKGLNQESIISRFGNPNTIIICPSYKLFVYNENHLVLDDNGKLISNETK